MNFLLIAFDLLYGFNLFRLDCKDLSFNLYLDWYIDYLFSNYQLFNDSIHSYRFFNRNNKSFFNLYDLFFLYSLWNYFLCCDFLRNLFGQLYYSLSMDVYWCTFLNCLYDWHYFLNYDLDLLIYWCFYVFNDLDFTYSLLDHWDLNFLFYFFDYLFLNHSLY